MKDSGRTAYSRSGDGRAALGLMLREYLISEAMVIPRNHVVEAALAAATIGNALSPLEKLLASLANSLRRGR